MLQIAGEVPGLNGEYSINTPLPDFWEQVKRGMADFRLDCFGPKFPNNDVADTLRYSLATLLSHQNLGWIHGFQVQLGQPRPLVPELPDASQLHPITIMRESVFDSNVGNLPEYAPKYNPATGFVKVVLTSKALKINPAVLDQLTNQADLGVGGWLTLDWSPRQTSAGKYIATLRGLRAIRL